MSQTFIAAYDGSAASRAAVELAVELAAAQDAEVVAAHVYPQLKPVGLRGGVIDKEMQTSLHDSGRAVLEGLDVDGVSRRVLLAGSPAQALHDLAEEEHAALVAVGVTHRRHVGRVAPGSVGSNLLHGAPCPVLAVPADREPGPIRTIVARLRRGRAGAQRARACRRARTRERRAAHRRRRLRARGVRRARDGRGVRSGPAPARRAAATRVQRDVEGLAGVTIETRVVPGPAARSSRRRPRARISS